MVTSAHCSSSSTEAMSSWMQHFPGVLLQQTKQPLHGEMSKDRTDLLRSSMPASASLMPSTNAEASLRELLDAPFGLPLMSSTLIAQPPSLRLVSRPALCPPLCLAPHPALHPVPRLAPRRAGPGRQGPTR